MKLGLIAYMAVQQRDERSAEKQDLGSASVDVEGFGLAAATSQWGKVLETCNLTKSPLCMWYKLSEIARAASHTSIGKATC
jgi:hypothetical protein